MALLDQHLANHLARQRWSGAHGRTITSVTPRWHEVLRDDDVVLLWTLVDVAFSDDQDQAYQLFIGVRANEAAAFLSEKDRRRIAVVAGDDGDLAVYDAFADPELAIYVLHLVAPDVEVEGLHPTVLEHSNTSIVYDRSSVLKVFRKVEPGPNPDVEIPRTLAARGYQHLLPPLAELRRDGTDLAVLRRFLVGSTEGWDLAAGSVRDLLDGRASPEDAGADFGPEAARLGAVVAKLHLAMAESWGRGPGDPTRWAEEMEAQVRLLAHSTALRQSSHQLELEPILARYRDLAILADTGSEHRIHGDLHLSQVLLADEGWYILDFEGEPARRRADRANTSSPLRDVAGMLRSFHYAAATGLAQWTGGDPPPDPELVELGEAWDGRNRSCFFQGYLAVDGIDALLPDQADNTMAVLAAFELDKAVYEVGYELAYRPDRAWIPLGRIERLTQAGTRG